MTSQEIRQKFLDYFAKQDHKIVDSAPMINKHDPTLMFTNAGMNQFKDSFLGNTLPPAPRVADTQKCLRVSGKHNDLEEVGRDSYHQTMFEMLGNWSFGDYFKKEAITWAWELLTDVFGLPAERLYVTIFEGDASDNLPEDSEARELWTAIVPEERVLAYGKKDNFWEMGDVGPCGPCSEIHIDLRSDKSRADVSGASLVNADNPEVIELWNLVFIQFNRKADGSLEDLPARHIDTGMGFERLCMVVQGKTSNYDSDVFSRYINYIEKHTGIKYTGDYSGESMSDIAMRVVADHTRALFFGIADGQIPSNSGAGYVLRRILRRAVRYYYSFLSVEEPFLHTIVPLIVDYFKDVFPGVSDQEEFITEVIREEEKSFLRTLESGLKRFEKLNVVGNEIKGDEVFELYDTYGFPIDLTRLIAEEKGLVIDEEGFELALQEQKERSRADAKKETGDWITVRDGKAEFVGYDILECETSLLRYRQVESKGKTQYQVVLEQSPFYPEGGGQVGDTGTLRSGEEVIRVLDTIKENDLAILITDKLPSDQERPVNAQVDSTRRLLIENNHSATHLVHAALREVLGEHVAQKGSLLNEDHLRFDFSHFGKVTDEEIRQIEDIVNQRIRDNIKRKEDRAIPMEEARSAGAMMLFGEKYGDKVRMITFDPGFSVELCGGCHVPATGRIGLFKIVSESAVAAGVRRIEAVTAARAEEYVNNKLQSLESIRDLLKHPADIVQAVDSLLNENKTLRKELEDLKKGQVSGLKDELLSRFEKVGDVQFLAIDLNDADSKAVKDLVFKLNDQVADSFVLVSTASGEKVQLQLGINKSLTDKAGLNAGQIIRELAPMIGGGGGGQPFYASAGGKDASGLTAVFEKARTLVEDAVS